MDLDAKWGLRKARPKEREEGYPTEEIFCTIPNGRELKCSNSQKIFDWVYLLAGLNKEGQP
jgi:hypothetical protein